MTTDNWFAALCFLAVYFTCLLLLDGAHKTYIAELKRVHYIEVTSMKSYIRTLIRERKWLEAELERIKAQLSERQDRAFDPFLVPSKFPEHIQFLPPSEEYDDR